MNTILKQLKFHHRIVNRLSKNDFFQQKPLLLFSTEISEQLDKNFTKPIHTLSLNEQQKHIREIPQLQDFYKDLAPYAFYSTISQMQSCFILKANFYKKINLFEFLVFDVDGFYLKFVSLEDFIPVPYEDFLSQIIKEVPFIQFIDHEQVFKHQSQKEFYLFLDKGKWEQTTADLDEFDFRNLFNEEKSCIIMSISRKTKELEVNVSSRSFSFKEGLREIQKQIIQEIPEDKEAKISYLLSKYFLTKTFGIIGFPKFLDGYYIFFITKKEKVCEILKSNVYRVVEAKLEILLNDETNVLYNFTSDKSSEIKYLDYFNAMDYTALYFSYEIDITNRLQNLLGSKKELFQQQFIWNAHLLKPFLDQKQISSQFILPMIYGYVESQKLKIGLKDIEIGIISRRSRYQVGTRFLKRGLDDKANPANEVESEFFVIENFPMDNSIKNLFSYVFYRGSIPLFWAHEKTKISPKPKIIINENKDPYRFQSKKHFENLFQRYGPFVFVLNLVKQNPKSSEQKLGQKYQEFLDFYISKLRDKIKGNQLFAKWIDFFESYNVSEKNLISKMQLLGAEINENIGFFHQNYFEGILSEQKGVIRINCIDCLDRTNNTIACLSGVIFAQMLLKIEIQNPEDFIDQNIPSVKNQLLSILFEMIGKNGDEIAKQYAGSEAFHKAQLYKIDGDWKTIKQNITLIAVKRYLNNILTDFEKQKSFNLFLGTFEPQNEEGQELWNVVDEDDLFEEFCDCRIQKDLKSIYPEVTREEKLVFKAEKMAKKFKTDLKNLPLILESENLLQKKMTFIDLPKEKKILKEKETEINHPNYFNFQQNFHVMEEKAENFEFYMNLVNFDK